LEQVRLVFFGDANTGVGNADENMCLVPANIDCHLAFRRVFDRVFDKVLDDLA
jgi:hypothetical protein